MAIGPQIYWGANPTAILRISEATGFLEYFGGASRRCGQSRFDHHIECHLEQPLRRSALYASRNLGGVKLEVGGLLSGLNKVGQPFHVLKKVGITRTLVIPLLMIKCIGWMPWVVSSIDTQCWSRHGMDRVGIRVQSPMLEVIKMFDLLVEYTQLGSW